MEHVNRIIAELSGDSRDIAFRRALEETARNHLACLLVHEEYETIDAWYAPDVTMVTGLDTTLDGEILKGHDEIKMHYEALHDQAEILLVPVLAVSDRGRITVYTETYYKWLGKVEDDAKDRNVEPPFVRIMEDDAKDDIVEPPFVGWPAVSYGDVLKSREVVVFDLNDEMKVKRVEWRQLGMDLLGKVSLDAQARKSEELQALIQGDI
ncbi:hypothetical protein CMUS01_10088 [Colletotrichum musicola]|uniref:SnoaL-like domain-containing protein n=1 Tax=Colletotrichum musicola TaxID=2175873 RepID=A0A8H6K5F8_9PEZI|nr:hypothetical protein CMUS01_10088 [Colletotrichum musicola]